MNIEIRLDNEDMRFLNRYLHNVPVWHKFYLAHWRGVFGTKPYPPRPDLRISTRYMRPRFQVCRNRLFRRTKNIAGRLVRRPFRGHVAYEWQIMDAVFQLYHTGREAKLSLSGLTAPEITLRRFHAFTDPYWWH